MSDTMRFFDLKTPAPKRLAMMRAAFAAHPTKYPHCPAHAKPKSWRDIRGTTHKGIGAYCGALSPGFYGTDKYKTHIWYSHTGEQFRGERFADEVARIEHTGWFTDSFQDEKARGIVARLTHGRFIAGYHWSSNGERVYFADVYDDETDAARAADSHAETFAEFSREDSERFEAMREAEDTETEAARVFNLARMARHVSADHANIAREALATLRTAREALADATAAYEKG